MSGGEGAGESAPNGAAASGEKRPAETDADELRAAKRRALEEFKRAALARIAGDADGSGAGGDAAGAGGETRSADGGGATEAAQPAEGPADEPTEPAEPVEPAVADLDIVDFLRRESEGSIGKLLASRRAESSDGGVITAAPVYERREPKAASTTHSQLVAFDPEKGAAGGKGWTRRSDGCSWAGKGGVSYNARDQIHQMKEHRYDKQQEYLVSAAAAASPAAAAAQYPSRPPFQFRSAMGGFNPALLQAQAAAAGANGGQAAAPKQPFSVEFRRLMKAQNDKREGDASGATSSVFRASDIYGRASQSVHQGLGFSSSNAAPKWGKPAPKFVPPAAQESGPVC